MSLTLEEFKKLATSEMIEILCKKYKVEQISINEITPEYMEEYLKLTFKSIDNIMKMSIKVHDLSTAALAGIIIKSMAMGPELHNDLSLILITEAQKFIKNNTDE